MRELKKARSPVAENTQSIVGQLLIRYGPIQLHLASYYAARLSKTHGVWRKHIFDGLGLYRYLPPNASNSVRKSSTDITLSKYQR